MSILRHSVPLVDDHAYADVDADDATVDVNDVGDAGVVDAVGDVVGAGNEADGDIRISRINSTSRTASATPVATTSATSTVASAGSTSPCA